MAPATWKFEADLLLDAWPKNSSLTSGETYWYIVKCRLSF